MIRAQIELHPLGDESRKRVLAVIDIGNVSVGASADADYLVRATVDEVPQPPFRLNGHVRADGWGPLVARALKQLGLLQPSNR